MLAGPSTLPRVTQPVVVLAGKFPFVAEAARWGPAVLSPLSAVEVQRDRQARYACTRQRALPQQGVYNSRQVHPVAVRLVTSCSILATLPLARGGVLAYVSETAVAGMVVMWM